MRKIYLVICCLFISAGMWAQGVTTSSVGGTVTDLNGDALIGANVTIIHVPSGSTAGTITNIEGRYSLANLRVGGPYRITFSYLGYQTTIQENVFLNLGENQRIDGILADDAVQLEGIEVIGRSGLAGQSSGANTNINSEMIDVMPTLDRNLNDFLRLTPQASTEGDGISFAGMNNRFNAIYIDGAVNNDVFGLASSGTNGGQTGISPFSMDIIDQFQVVLSPYDVTMGGFAGGGINAVTKSGTNTLKGSAYYFLQNENFVGKTNKVLADRLNVEREKVDEFTQKTYGFSLGGPIVKDKIFFFTNVELQDDVTPRPFEIEQYTSVDGRYSVSDINRLRDHLINTYNYDPGTFGSTAQELQGTKIFAKIDANLSQSHRLTIRHNYTKGEQFNRFSGGRNVVNFSNNGIYFPTTTNSSAIELNSRLSDNISNNLIVGYTRVRDDRKGLGDNFPYVFIDDANSGVLRFGTEEFSTANQLDQDILSITNNLKLYKGNHTFTFGTHNEFYSLYNLFIPQNFGTYRFRSIDDFIEGVPAYSYDRSYSLVDDITGGGSAAAADFKAMQIGLYAQNEWSVNRNLTLTIGLRLDLPIITDDPVEDVYFNTTALPLLKEKYSLASSARAGQAPDGQLMFSPRLGFEYDFDGRRNTILRGGIGVFTSRIPFVWPGAMFNNNGLTLGTVRTNNFENGEVPFISEWDQQHTNPDFSIPSGQMNLFADDFKYPQVLRGNLALDHVFDNGLKASVEGIYTKTLNNILYTNINSNPDVSFSWTGNGGDTRDVFVGQNIDNTYSEVYLATNTSEGYSYNFTATLEKNFHNGLSALLAYTYGDSYALSEGTSSQNSSQWRGQVNINGRNNPVFGRSDFSVGHRIISAITYRIPWGEATSTSISLFYNGQSGTAFSYVIGGNNARNINNERGSTGRNRSLVFVPETINDINLVDYTLSDGTMVSAADQWERLDNFIKNDDGLNDRRGQYSEKNGSRNPYSSIFDLAIRQDIGTFIGESSHRLQISLDVFNVANLINPEWGTKYTNPGDFNNSTLYQFEGYEADGTTPRFTFRESEVGKDWNTIAGFTSRWRMRVGVRYIFN